jgi:hypothetical protein
MNSFARPSSAAFIQVSSKVATAPFLVAIDAGLAIVQPSCRSVFIVGSVLGDVP